MIKLILTEHEVELMKNCIHFYPLLTACSEDLVNIKRTEVDLPLKLIKLISLIDYEITDKSMGNIDIQRFTRLRDKIQGKLDEPDNRMDLDTFLASYSLKV